MPRSDVHDRFATTRWSVVMQLAAADGAAAHGAMHELTRRYWFPVYVFLRHSGHPPPVAEGISRAFLHALLRRFRTDASAPPRGHFRRYLLDQLHAFLSSDWRDVVDTDVEALAAPTDLEARYRDESAGPASPEQAYHAAFAREIISRAYRRLSSEASRSGHKDMFDSLEPYLERDATASEYADLSKRLTMRPLAIVVALKRLRDRFRDMVGEELADTVTSAEELAAEQATLLALVRGGNTDPT